jgi:hypothetical protein
MRCVAAVGGLRGCGVVRWELQKAGEYVSCDGGSSNASLRSRRVVWFRVACRRVRGVRECPESYAGQASERRQDGKHIIGNGGFLLLMRLTGINAGVSYVYISILLNHYNHYHSHRQQLEPFAIRPHIFHVHPSTSPLRHPATRLALNRMKSETIEPPLSCHQ